MQAIVDGTHLLSSPGVTMTFSSELMQNYATGKVIDAANPRGLAAVRDAAGELAVLSLSPRGDLFLTRHDTASPTGWKQRELPFSNGTISRFDAAQNAAGNVVIYAVASDRKLHSMTLPAADAELASQWTQHPFVPEGEVALLKVAAPDGEAQPVVALAVKDQSGRVRPHLLNAGDDVPSFPVDVAAVLDMQPGFIADKGTAYRGAFALFRLPDGTTSITFVGRAHRPYSRTYAAEAIPPDAAALAIIPGGADLFVGGHGIVRFPGEALTSRLPQGEVVARPEALDRVVSMHIRGDAVSPSVWALTAANDLHRIARNASGVWSFPSVVRKNVHALAPIRNAAKDADELVLRNASQLVHEWIDPRQSVWKGNDIAVADDGKLQVFDSWSSQLQFTSAEGAALSNRAIEIVSSQWIEATVNGAPAILDAAPFRAVTDPLGNLSIVHRAASLGTPVFTVKIDGAVIGSVNPATKVRDRLRTVKSADDMAAMKLPNGQPLFKGSRDELAAGATALTHLTAVKDALPQDGSLQPPEVTAQRIGEAFTPWGLSFTPDGVALLDAAAVAELIASREVRFDFWAAIGDALRVITNTVASVVQVVFETVANATIRIGDAIIHFAVESVSQALDAINAVAARLGAEIDKLTQVLGFFFDRDEILTLHKVLINVATQTMKFARSRVNVLKERVDEGFTRIERELNTLQLPPALANATLFGYLDHPPSELAKLGPATDLLTKSPVGTLAGSQLANIAQLPAAALLTVPDDLAERVRQSLERALPAERIEKLRQTVESIVVDVRKAFSGHQTTLGDVFAFFRKLFTLPLEVARLIVGALNDLIGAMLDAVIDSLSEEISIPFVSAFYREYVGHDAPFTLLGGILLLVAIPVNAVYKLVTGTAPFPDRKTFGLDTITAEQLFGGSAVAAFDVNLLENVLRFVLPVVGVISRVLGAIEAVLTTPSVVLVVLQYIVTLVIAMASAPFTTPFKWELYEISVWALWILDIGALLVLHFGGALPKILRAAGDVVSIIASFILGFLYGVAELGRKPKHVALPVLTAADTAGSLFADGAVLCLNAKSAEVQAAAGIAAVLGMTVACGSSIAAAILHVVIPDPDAAAPA
ncbi:MAG TPA: hypothetical protein VFN10_22500 [Thermoanaerobaculia bacterium]|nr:hypothetical protein [Thermoanaerobaculia bacterium]